MSSAAGIEVRIEPMFRGFTRSLITRCVSSVLKREKAGKGKVGVWVTDDRTIRKINRKFLKHDFATDVISFSLEEAGFLGDLVVSAETARRMARELKVPFKEELARYVIHGTLHLLGYDDKKPADRKKMHRRQEEILKELGLA